MNILVIAAELPWPPYGGGKLRVYNLLRRLAERHTLHILCFLHDPSEDALLDEVREWAGVTGVPWTMPPVYAAMEAGEDPDEVARRSPLPFLAAYFDSDAMREAVAAELSTGRYDAMLAVTSMMGQFLPENLSIPAAVDLWNLETLVAQRAYERSGEAADRIQWEKTRAYEGEILSRCAIVLPVSDKEREDVARLFGHPNVVTLDNGVDTAAYQPTPIPPGPFLLFTGTMNYAPNTEGLLYLAEQIWPLVLDARPDARLTVVGQNPPPEVLALDRGPIAVTGFVPDVRPYFDAARACVVPLLSGGGTRLKILEAMAAGRPIVSTTLGQEGLAAEDGVHLLLADTPVDFAAALVRVLSDDALANSLAHAGRRLVEERYDWSALATRLEAALENVCGLKPR